ncbi:GAF domain-containing protein [Hymenobacter lutimineralis]|uniref:GAF domain-containing protein n=1 Tax=Hymenobacter lutimineralis TaxID=2606448 RepID=A0A5D6VAM6_9BACT|nr:MULTISPECIES: GAF domain-containing protein [Hymenobacter]QIX61910.1 GAF domain-containing protein [Hymenobacter sp. BT18]TYZ12586.1 GAF domain-containing protein [Hymenobacter lutimineralis]
MTTDEYNRLAELDSYDILYSAREKLFDNLVELAAYIFSVPVARIAFVHELVVWHKASVGMPPQETLTLEQTLCPRAVASAEPVLVYPDLATEPLNSTAMTQARQIRFYAGVPVCTPQGFRIGTLCLAGYEPRELTAPEQQLLTHLADLVTLALEARRHLLSVHQLQAWEQLREEAEEALHNQMAVVRYLKARSAGQVPVPADLLDPIGKRLAEVAQVLKAGLPAAG